MTNKGAAMARVLKEHLREDEIAETLELVDFSDIEDNLESIEDQLCSYLLQDFPKRIHKLFNDKGLTNREWMLMQMLDVADIYSEDVNCKKVIQTIYDISEL